MYRIDQNNISQTPPHFKQNLINFIYDNVDVSRFRYDILQYESDLPKLLENKYFVSANFSGSNCLLVFCKIRDKYHSFLVDRKTLSYNINKINFNNINLINVKVKLDIDIYKGSIFDGIYIQTKHEKTFVITDVYMFKGNDFTNSQIDSKLITLRTYLISNYNTKDPNNTIIIAVNKLYKLEEINELIKIDIPKIKDFVIKSVCFYPEISGTKSIFKFDNKFQNTNIKTNNFQNTNIKTNNFQNTNIKTNNFQNTNIQDQNQIQVSNEIKEIKKIIYIPNPKKKEESYIFEMKKSEIPDVYMLNIITPVMKDGKKRLKVVKVGIAYIPNIEKSKWCKEIIESRESNNGILVHCCYHKDKYKWEQMKIANDNSKPSMVSEFVTKEI